MLAIGFYQIRHNSPRRLLFRCYGGRNPGMISDIYATQNVALVAPGHAVRNQGENTAESRRVQQT